MIKNKSIFESNTSVYKVIGEKIKKQYVKYIEKINFQKVFVILIMIFFIRLLIMIELNH